MRSWRFLSTSAILSGIFLIVIGILWLLDMLGVFDFNICIIGPLLLIAAGIFLLIHSRYQKWW